ncbi:hypothetical protein SDC9_41256 [bioreactor metagenome]|jgi:hypothetical protein|uniref:Uncharacterized protein n=1 Tax=bioreactor metagenome TaxID=1076179 RepID=A0A644VX92_9ZZZZ|nr:hypothetical protein [Paludibacter sp.]
MKISMQKALGIMLLSTATLLINSCVDPMYDMAKGVNTEISIGGDSLALPIGSTDTITLGDFLSSDDMEFLKTMEDGGYGMTISDSLSIEDILKDLDTNKLKFDDQVFNQTTSVSFGDIDVSDFVIPGFNKTENLDMNIPTMQLGDIVPAVNMDQNFTVNFSNYALDESKLVLQDQPLNTGKPNLLADVSPFVDYTTNINPVLPFSLPQPIDIGNLSVTINYQIDVPEGITTIHQIDLDAGGQLEIELALGGVSDAMNTGTFTPNITIDPTNLFKFSPLAPLTNGNIVFSNADALNDFNSHSTIKTLDIDAFHNLPDAVNKLIDISKIVNVTGSIDASGEVKQNKIQEAKQIDLIINVKVKNVKIKSMDFDIPTFTTTLSGSSAFDINNNDIPEQINTINTVYFGKTNGSSLPTNLVINIKPSNLPVMKTSSYKIDNLDITFPSNFTFSSMAGQTYSATNVTLDPVNGYFAEINLTEIDLSQVTITNKVLTWSGNISYNGQISINGRMDSKNINTSSNPVVNLKSESAIKLNSALVTTNNINESIQSTEIEFPFEIDIADQVARLGVINVKPGCFVRIDITKPNLPLALKGDNIILQFSDLYEFQPNPNLTSNNAYIINGDIPDFIQLELKSLKINQDLVNGTLELKDTFAISGGIILQSGTVSSTAIESLGSEKLAFVASVSDMAIESTSIQMKTLEATFKDSTVLNMEINDIPTEIAALDSILLKDGAEIDLEIAINNMPDLGTNPLNADIKIKFPELLNFITGAVNTNNELVINQPFVDGKLTKKVGLKGLKFDGSDLNGKLSIDDQVNFDVNVSVVDPTVNSADLNGEDITVNVKVTLKGLEFKSVYGRFNVDFGDQMNIPNLALDDLPDFMRGDDVVLDISNPVLALRTESNIGIPVNTLLSLTKFKNGTAQTDDKIDISFSLPKANSPAETVKTFNWYAPTNAGMPSGYQFKETNIQNLFKPIPDSVKIDLSPTIDAGYQHFIDLAANYKLKVKYDITIPFTFGKDLSIMLKDTINDVNLNLGDINLKTGGLELSAKIFNSIPLNLNLELLLVDSNFNILAAPEAQTILAGAPNGTAVESNLKIRLADNLESLKSLNKVVMVFRATSDETVAGTPIKPDNFIKAELKARVLGGIKVTL